VVIRSEVIDAHNWTEIKGPEGPEWNGEPTFATQVDLRAVEPSPALSWIEVNEATYKLTDGTMERTPASHGQWGGFNIERGIAWVFDTSLPPHNKPAWCAACGDRKYGPTANLEMAKQAAMDFALTAALPR
jgi:hypothetical protein